MTKFVPLLPTLLMYWASYQLSQAKNKKEEKQDEFTRLNEENTRLSEELDRYRKMVATKEREISKLQREIIELRKFAAGAPDLGALFDEKGKKDDDS
ncbi:DUF3450 domain-containing protein [Lactobacillus delbrueckii subsp. bulgaricus]|uniref:DUF3450 domain-containing protein n=1 Tax=Lactobacillus delbrueckii TaxID=1584 RepID=UPI001BFFBBDF|nr:DUF3450 domain-containing protein [Lactobacillus delbrueckii]MCD9217909.1 DUF3450 domain-containing protein [Lactobacillus delbrueckii subsp. lactis]MDA3848422.1 DUF3450 domain-containing protein [Lactobacillus delbrueckii]